jgi:DHA2 family multidrug resistance protein-like MFS transporter
MATLGGAVAISRQLPADVSAALVDAAREAFQRGLTLCATISGVGSLALAIFAAATFRRVGLAPQHTAEHQVGVIA